MSHPYNPLEIFKVLDKSNCRACGEPTCLAFAAAVSRGDKTLDQCPRMDKQFIERYGGEDQEKVVPDSEHYMEEKVTELKRQIKNVDLLSAAQRTAGRYSNGVLDIKVLGHTFSVDEHARIFTYIHTNPWVTIPVLNYIINSQGKEPSGKWIPFRELNYGLSWLGLFEQRCEKPLTKVADCYTDLFQDLLLLFDGKHWNAQLDADISMVLHPLPLVPLLICYWKPDKEFESSLSLLFDSATEFNLSIESLFALSTGLARMFERIAARHGSEGT